MRVLNDEEIKRIFLEHFAKQYGEEAAKELLEQLPDCKYAKAIAKAQHQQDIKDFSADMEGMKLIKEHSGHKKDEIKLVGCARCTYEYLKQQSLKQSVEE